jgi:hypothetical protein
LNLKARSTVRAQGIHISQQKRYQYQRTCACTELAELTSRIERNNPTGFTRFFSVAKTFRPGNPKTRQFFSWACHAWDQNGWSIGELLHRRLASQNSLPACFSEFPTEMKRQATKWKRLSMSLL